MGHPAHWLGTRRWLLCFLVVIAIPTSAFADKEADTRFERGRALYAEGNFVEASKEFEASFEIEPQFDVLYSWAQSERKAGACEHAIALYERFLRGDVPEKAAKSAKENLTDCQNRVAGVTGTKTATVEGKSDEPDTTNEAVDKDSEVDDGDIDDDDLSRPRKGWFDRLYDDPVRVGMVGGGLIVAGVGVGLLFSAGGDARAAEQNASDFDRLTSRAKTKRIIAGASFGVAAALVVTGAIWERPTTHERFSLGPVVDSDFAGVSVFGTF